MQMVKEEFGMFKKVYFIVSVFILIFSACAPIQEPATPVSQPTEKSPIQSTQESVILTANGDSQQVVIHWQRSGGFAGICQEMDIFADGHTVIRDCGTDQVLASGNLPEQERVKLKDWLENYQQFSWKFNPPKGSADMFLDEFTFSGIGDQVPPEQTLEMVNQELAATAQSLMQQPTQ